MAEEVAVHPSPTAAGSPLRSDNKRKLDEVEPGAPEATVEPTSTNQQSPDPDFVDGVPESDSYEAKRPRLDDNHNGLGNQNGHKLENSEEPVKEEENPDEPAKEETSDEPAKLNEANEQQTNTRSPQVEPQVQAEQEPEDDIKDVNCPVIQQVTAEHTEADIAQEPSNEENMQPTRDFFRDEHGTIARKMEIPNNKVGVLIGKAGETIRSLQNNSGAKIQITKDAEADPHSSTRPVEIVGDLASIEKAEVLIKAVISEAEAGGSGSLGARGLAGGYSARVSEQIEMPVPNEKVGLIIGKGGETIKGLQNRSGARIQLIPQQEDGSQERTVRISGSRKQIEMASVMIKDVMNQTLRPSASTGGFNQQSHRPRGPPGGGHWGGPQHGPPPMSYDYHQRGSSYPSQQNPRYQPPQNYGGYPQQQQMGPRSNYGSGWEHRPPPQSGGGGGGYDHQYGGHPASGPPAHIPPPGPVGPPPPSQANYNYGPPPQQGPGYGNPPAPYSHTPPQQSYGQGGYDDNHAPTQHAYGGYPQAGYGPPQQQYSKAPPSYGAPQHGPPPTSYGPPRPSSQPGDGYNQQPSYGSNVPTQQYPYASSGPPPVQQTYPPPYSAQPAVDGYNNNQQPPVSSGPGYAQQPNQAYSQPQSAGYGQVAPPAGGGYGAYPMTQQGYTEQTAVNSGGGGYGYQQQAPQDSAYNTGGGTTSAYGASVQPNYGQPAPSQPTYDQSAAPQPGGYVAAPASAPAAYGKTL